MGKPRKPRRKLTAMEKLTVKQQRFVLAKIQGATNDQAVVQAGYACSPENNKIMGDYVVKSPRVRAALSEVIEEEFPDVRSKAAKVLDNLLVGDPTEQMVSGVCPQCGANIEVAVQVPMIKTGDRLKTIELLSKLFGWNAPSKSQKLVATVDYKLPTDED